LGFKSEFLAFAFGVLIVLVTFGDDHLGMLVGTAIGNLDTILGFRLWPLMDVIYPLATISVFLLYGASKRGELRLDLKTALLFGSFLVTLVLVNIDDFALVLHLSADFPLNYWATISLIYPVYGLFSFFLFGKLSEKY
jgi:hypothetical protein